VLCNAQGTSFNAYVRTHSNETSTLYTANPQKDSEGVKRDDILPRFTGTLSHDHEAKFYNFGMAHATCGAHLLRELKGLFELQKIPWTQDMRSFIASINDHKNADTAAGITSCDPEILAQFRASYDLLLESGRKALRTLKTKELGYDELRKMLKRLAEFKDNYLLFICDYRAPFTNNLAERDLRPCKTKQKVSGCFRSWRGIQIFVRIRSFISTLKRECFLLCVNGIINQTVVNTKAAA
jgi:transposase